MFSKTKALNKTCFKNICRFGSFKLLYYAVEWLEITHAISWKFDPDGEFTDLLEKSGREDIKNLKRGVERPPETWAEIEQMMQPKQPQKE